MSTLAAVTTVPLPIAIRRFALHFMEMCVVMCAGGAVLSVAIFGAATAFGHPNLVGQAPELSILIIGIDFALAMAAYMALRGHPTRHNLEMSGSTVVGALVLVGGLWLGWIPQATLDTWSSLFAFMCGPLCVLMFVVMAARFDHYGGRVGARTAAAGPTLSTDYTCSMHPEVGLPAPGRCPICGMTLKRRLSSGHS